MLDTYGRMNYNRPRAFTVAGIAPAFDAEALAAAVPTAAPPALTRRV
ncbi:MAG: hypothetical protein VB104_11610 [Candidatus Limiplasma sp.]|nr:hypothetical protein [Candidatus Limiplasma sp.]